MIFLPKELPDLRNRMLAFAEGPFGDFLTWQPATDDRSDQDREKAARLSADMEAETLRQAELFHISDSMVELMMQAKDGLGDVGFMDYDLIAPAGIAVLGRDILSEREVGPGTNLDHLPEDKLAEASVEERRQIQLMVDHMWYERLLVAWRAMPPEAGYEHGSVKVSWYFERESWLDHIDTKAAILEKDSSRFREDAPWLPPYVFDGHTIIACHPEASQVRVERRSGNNWDGRRTDMFRVMCYLLRQRVAEEVTVMPDRAARRRMAREGEEPPAVRVISIRGASATGGGDGGRDYVHRWIVRGHWRRQWYRSIQQNRPIWITPYVKGPEGAPLLGGEKVYAARGMQLARGEA